MLLKSRYRLTATADSLKTTENNRTVPIIAIIIIIVYYYNITLKFVNLLKTKIAKVLRFAQLIAPKTKTFGHFTHLKC